MQTSDHIPSRSGKTHSFQLCSPIYADKSGPLQVTMKNDYLFKAVLQSDPYILKDLVAGLLHLSPKEILSITVENPIELGRYYQEKTFVLDLKLILNNQKLVNLEMQISNERNWKERSLGYLCRSFDSINRGEHYQNMKEAYHFGFLDYDLDPSHPEFFATYKMENIKNHNIYSDKFTLSVIQLNHIHLATEEDKAYRIDKWARFFAAATWEELKMLAENDEIMRRATELFTQYSEIDPHIREAVEARQLALNGERAMERRMARQLQQLAENEKQLAENEKQLAENEKQLAENEKIIQEKDAFILQQARELALLKAQLNEKNCPGA